MKFETKYLNDVVYFQEGPGVRNFQFRNEGVKLLNVGNINNGVLNTSTTKLYISEEEAYGKYKHFLVDDGDLLIASSGIVVNNFHNKIAFASKEDLPLCLNTSTIRFKSLNNSVSLEYLKFFLKTSDFKDQLKKLITGSAQLNFGPSHLRQICIPFPKFSDQLFITNILCRAEKLITNRKESIRLLDEFLKSTFLEMFGDPFNNKLGFDLVTIEDVSTAIKDGPHVSPEYAEDGIPLLSTRNIRPGQLILEDMKYVSLETYKELTRRFKPQKNDVLVTKGGTTGFAKVVDFDFQFCIWVHLAVIRPNEKVLPLYLEHFINSDYGYTQTQKYTRGIANHDLGLTRIAKIKLLLPPTKLQSQFTQIATNTSTLKVQFQSSLHELENLYHSLSQQAFKGELNAKDEELLMAAESKVEYTTK